MQSLFNSISGFEVKKYTSTDTLSDKKFYKDVDHCLNFENLSDVDDSSKSDREKGYNA